MDNSLPTTIYAVRHNGETAMAGDESHIRSTSYYETNC